MSRRTLIRLLAPSDVLGRRIEMVWGRYQPNAIDGWLDSASAWLTLDNSVTLSWPVGDASEWWSERVPVQARLWQCHSAVPEVGVVGRVKIWLSTNPPIEVKSRIAGARIAAVHRPIFDREPDSARFFVFELDDGRALTFTSLAPNGTADAGLHIHAPGDLDSMKVDGELSPFWPEADETNRS